MKKVSKPSSVKSPTKRGSDSAKRHSIDAKAIVADLKRRGSQKVRDGMRRFAVPSDNAFGVTVGDLQKMAKQLGRNHELAQALWASGWYEARMLATLVDEPSAVTPGQMDQWCRDFDSWAICDTACFHLFDRTPHVWTKILAWSKRKPEFEKRAAFALLACFALHNKDEPDEPFARSLTLIEKAAVDERNFVKKAVNWALRGIGRRNPKLNFAAVAVARRLAEADDRTARWIGKDALRELTGAIVKRKLAPPKSASKKATGKRAARRV